MLEEGSKLVMKCAIGVKIVSYFCHIKIKDVECCNTFNNIVLGLKPIEAQGCINAVVCRTCENDLREKPYEGI
uniref:Uncharacterized protein n=1 Tax=Nymphaea colorata TaxID=210225 RepID=A0A5K0ZJQ5_9MAGN